MEDLLRKTEGAYGLIIFVALTAAHLVAPSCMTTSGVNFCPLPRPAAPYKQLTRHVQVDGSRAMETETEVLEGTSGRHRRRLVGTPRGCLAGRARVRDTSSCCL